MSRTITISPITRLEGHGKIDIVLDDAGEVVDAWLQVVELRGFERFCEGRPVEELPRITPKICGVCPGAHHMASAKACDAVYGVEIPPAARKLRELYLAAHIAHSHLLHFFALAAPDFVPGAAAPAASRNVLGLVEAVGLDVGKKVLKNRGYAQTIQGIIAGHPIHPVAGLPGGMTRAVTEDERARIETMADSLVGFAHEALALFADAVLGAAPAGRAAAPVPPFGLRRVGAGHHPLVQPLSHLGRPEEERPADRDRVDGELVGVAGVAAARPGPRLHLDHRVAVRLEHRPGRVGERGGDAEGEDGGERRHSAGRDSHRSLPSAVPTAPVRHEGY